MHGSEAVVGAARPLPTVTRPRKELLLSPSYYPCGVVMAVEPFSLIAGSAISWAVGKILDATLNCFCGASRPTTVTNTAFNAHSCQRCNRALDQFTNATIHTVNRNRSIAAAHVSNVRWPAWRDTFRVGFDLDVVNSRYEDVVVELVLSQFRGSEFAHNTLRFHPEADRYWWREPWFSVDRRSFPVGQYIFAIDLRTYNLWGDLLHNVRCLGDVSRTA